MVVVRACCMDGWAEMRPPAGSRAAVPTGGADRRTRGFPCCLIAVWLAGMATEGRQNRLLPHNTP